MHFLGSPAPQGKITSGSTYDLAPSLSQPRCEPFFFLPNILSPSQIKTASRASTGLRDAVNVQAQQNCTAAHEVGTSNIMRDPYLIVVICQKGRKQKERKLLDCRWSPHQPTHRIRHHRIVADDLFWAIPDLNRGHYFRLWPTELIARIKHDPHHAPTEAWVMFVTRYSVRLLLHYFHIGIALFHCG